MKHHSTHHRITRQALWLLPLLAALFLMTSCQSIQEANSNTSANTSNSANTTAQSSSGYIDLVGKWEGQAGGKPSTLFISNHKGETFSGTETVGDNQIAIAGVVDLKTREITIRETNVDKGDKKYPLGAGTGTIAPNGRQMSGEWKTKGSASTFSFTK